jgi:gas vesicle protein
MGEDTQGLRQDIDDTRGELTRDVDALTEKVSPSRIFDRGVQRTRGRMSDMKERVMGSAEDAVGSVRGGVSSAGDSVSDTASDAAIAVKEKTQGNPLAAGLIAFGAGWLVSSLLPASEKETQLASKAVDTAKEYGQPLAHEAADVTAQIGQDMKTSAQEAVQSVKSTAADAASTVKDEGRSSASTIADQAKSSSN